ncbi:MAG: hypothetical protein IJV01_08095 [Bacteroidales bacterium]|nr:hypothetical protein [Bacteroidales bacterium]
MVRRITLFLFSLLLSTTALRGQTPAPVDLPEGVRVDTVQYDPLQAALGFHWPPSVSRTAGLAVCQRAGITRSSEFLLAGTMMREWSPPRQMPNRLAGRQKRTKPASQRALTVS